MNWINGKERLFIAQQLSKLEKDILEGRNEEAESKIKQWDNFFENMDGCWFSSNGNFMVYRIYKSLRQKYSAEQETVGVFE